MLRCGGGGGAGSGCSADDAEHAAGAALFGAVREVLAAAVGQAGAGGAVAYDGDGFGAEAGVEELAAISLPEIGVQLRA